MFERFRQRRVTRATSRAHDEWAVELADARAALECARAVGTPHESPSLLLHAKEVLVGTVTNVSLIEERSVGGHYSAGSQGVSIPIGAVAGRTIRYHVGRTKGHYVAGTPTPTAIDHGDLHITDQRIVFVGSNSTKECRFETVVSIQHSTEGIVTVALSNRVKNVIIHVGPHAVAFVDLCVNIGLARWHGQADQFIADLAQNVQRLETSEPPSS